MSGKTLRRVSEKSPSSIIEWTGVNPYSDGQKFVASDGSVRSLPQLKLTASRAEILEYFHNTWLLTEVLFSGIVDEAAFFCRPYHRLRHPLIFYYAHPAVVYINKLLVAGLLTTAVNAEFERLFEVGVDEMRWDDLHEGKEAVFPSVAAVQAYRKQVFDTICSIITSHPLLGDAGNSIDKDSPLWALVMGFEHERIHLETSSVLIRELPIDYVKKPEFWPAYYADNTPDTFTENTLIPVGATQITLGKPEDFPSYAWDNAYGNEQRAVRAFAASAHLISNAQFMEFVQDQGYTKENLWTREGWAWRNFNNNKWPCFWVHEGPAGLHRFKLRTIFEEIPMQESWPVCVNFYEAKAYCAWRSEKDGCDTPYRLLTEAEHHALRDISMLSSEDDIIFSSKCLAEGNNINLHSGSETSVNALPPNRKGFYDVFGNVWQWCEDHFHPLEGFKTHPYYEDFSVPCFDGKHQMILGGSFISTGEEASIWARYHFRPHFFQHAGFRIARQLDGNPACDAKLLHNNGSVIYESQDMLDKYLLMHWASDKEILDTVPVSSTFFPGVVHLPRRCAELVVEYTGHFDRALDLGCAVGRSTFELARHFNQVVGIDYSHEFITAAEQIKQQDAIEYWRKDSGDTGKKLRATRPSEVDVSRIRFEQGDACNLPLHIKQFDAVLMANVLCRLPDPIACLERMQGQNALVKSGGVLVMTTPFSWLEHYTPRSKWLDGINAVKSVLTDFNLIHQEELPFMIREHARKFEYIITHASVWRRNE